MSDLGGGYDAPNLTDEELAEHYANAVANGLEATKLVEIVEVKHAPGRIDCMGRVRPENEKDFVHGPIKALQFRLRGVAEIFTGKEFFLKGDRLIYAWVLSFGGSDMKAIVQAVAEALDEVMPSRDVEEAPLLGGGTPAGNLAQGIGSRGARGAMPIRG